MAVLVGAAYSWLAIAFWGRYVMNHPIHDWLLEVFATQGHRTLYFIGIYTHDALLNVLLAMPAAVALIAFKGSNNWTCVLVAVLAAVMVGYWDVETSALPVLLHSWGFWTDLAMIVFSLPIAFVAIRAFRERQSRA